MNLDLGQPGVDSQLARNLHSALNFSFVNFGVELQLGPPVEDYHVRGSSELEPADALPLSDAVSLLHSCHTAGNLHHSDLDQSHLSNLLAARIDDEDVAGRGTAEEWLRVIVVVHTFWLKAGVLQEVASRKAVRSFYHSRYGRVPSMIAPRAQKALIDSSTHKALVNDGLDSCCLSSQHIVEGVTALFEPKTVSCLNIFDWQFDCGQRIVLSCMGDSQGISLAINWPCSFVEFPCEPVVPAGESIMGLLRLADKVRVVDLLECFLAEPSIFPTVEVLERLFCFEHLSVVIENVLEESVDI